MQKMCLVLIFNSFFKKNLIQLFIYIAHIQTVKYSDTDGGQGSEGMLLWTNVLLNIFLKTCTFKDFAYTLRVKRFREMAKEKDSFSNK